MANIVAQAVNVGLAAAALPQWSLQNGLFLRADLNNPGSILLGSKVNVVFPLRPGEMLPSMLFTNRSDRIWAQALVAGSNVLYLFGQ